MEAIEHSRMEDRRTDGEVPVHALIDSLPAMIGYWDTGLRNRFANLAYVDFFGFSPQQMLGLHIRDVLGEQLFASNSPYINRALAGEPQLFDRAIVDTQGQVRHTQASYVPDVVDGVVQGFFVLVTDITARREAEMALERERRRIETVLDAVRDAVMSVDLSLIITDANRSSAEMFGQPVVSLVGQPVAQALDLRSADGEFDLRSQCLLALVHRRSVSVEGSLYVAGRSGPSRSVDLLITPQPAGSDPCAGLVVTVHDVTDSRRVLEEARRLALHDPLTGLWNREHLNSIPFEQGISVLFCDLDGFKQANDTCGHAAGDKILCEVVDVLRRGIRQGDDLVRIGGDEFVVVLRSCGLHDGINVADELVRAVEATAFLADDHRFPITMSVGVSITDVHACLEAVIDEADHACYAAKRAGGNRFEVGDLAAHR